MSIKCLITVLFLVIFCFISQGQSLSIRQRRSTADQELFHLIERMRYQGIPLSGILGRTKEIGKRQPQDTYSQLHWKGRAQSEDWPMDTSYLY